MSAQLEPEIKVTLKDGSVRAFTAGTTVGEVAAALSNRLRKEAVVGIIDGKPVDLNTRIEKDAAVEIFTLDDPLGVHTMRHSCAHLMAQAVSRLWPEVKFAIGPVIEEGFYYDFSGRVFRPEDLPAIEAEMAKIVKEDLSIVREEVSREAALELFSKRNDPFKVEIIRDLPEGVTISIYHQGEFTDLCTGPHLPATGRIKSFKLLNIAGAYWRGNSDNEMLQRIYATAWPKKAELDDYLYRIEEAKKRDHRKLGRELELFFLPDEAPGMPIYLPKGMAVRNEMEGFLRSFLKEYEYDEVKTPIIMDQELWERSGHWDHYKENMYFTHVDERDFALKPMNCPGHAITFKHKLRSYRDLPIRMGEFGLVHRHELSGALHGLLRVRAFTQDDAHLFVRPDQIEEEVFGCIEFIDRVYKTFGFEYRIELSTRPENSTGSDELWEKATEALRDVLESRGLPYAVNEGDGAFYGPKLDFHLRDSLKRSHQCGTIQLDFQMPEKFDLTYIGEDGNKHRPVMIHRAIFGSFERFMALLIEHYGGAFPLWLAPVQAQVIPVSPEFADYADQVRSGLRESGIRAEVDHRNEKMGYKIREAQMQKIPYTLVVGEQERSNGTVTVRKYGSQEQTAKRLEDFLVEASESIRTRQS